MARVAYGEDVPSPRLPVVESKRNWLATPTPPKRMVEEAWRPLVRRRVVEVELTAAFQLVVGVKGQAKVS